MNIAIIDYGVGNLRSVEKAFTTQGIEATVTDDESILRQAERLVLPGVGAFAACMNGLRQRGFDRLVIEAAQSGIPILGLCVGLQMMFEEGHEFGIHRGLGLMPGRVVRFPEGLHVPHIGWNQVHFHHPEHPLLNKLTDNSFFYFVHSFHVETPDEERVLGTTEYGITYPSICGVGSVVGVQFHPEKSQSAGLALLRQFASLTPEMARS
ncbi:MAG: imidazole glycerol phosphate synthase subunit HisH [Acidobacteria bacterium]|nr:imidazole glycerol phosphate synthase subunit HisH [Acidobacteriota bacterium]